MIWTEEKINALIESIGPPSVYYQFPEGIGQEPPFICFFYPEDSPFYADDTVYVRGKRLVIELYTAQKDWDLESAVENALARNGLAFTREEAYLESERMYMISYEMALLLETPVTEGENQNE